MAVMIALMPPRTKRLKNPTATAKDDPQDGTDSLAETLKLLVSNSWRRNAPLSPDDQRDRGNLPRQGKTSHRGLPSLSQPSLIEIV